MALLKRKRSGLNDAMSVVTKFVNACNRHDADSVAACLHPDFDSIQPMYPTRNFRGADQVRRNWQAIFDAEPGFRLTVLRSASVDDTIWLELHCAGEEAEVAGVFVMGIVGDRIRWARIYSALVEPVPEGVGQPPPALHEVPRHDEPAADGDVVEEALIAPVLDMERGSRRRRRRRDEEADDAEAAGPAPEAPAGTDDAEHVDAEEVDAEEVDAPVAADAPAVAWADGATEIETVVVAAVEQAEAVGGEAGSHPDPATTAEATEPDPDIVVAAPTDDDAGPPTEAVDVFTFADDEPEPEPEADPVGAGVEASAASAAEEPEPEPDAGDGPRRGLFGRKRP
ncbi:MAG: nuclear transport factor 2 family protein [Acidimicrobiales bacterium]